MQIVALLQIEPEIGASPHSFSSRNAIIGVTGCFSFTASGALEAKP